MPATLEMLIDPSGAEVGARSMESASAKIAASVDRATGRVAALDASIAKLPRSTAQFNAQQGTLTRQLDELYNLEGAYGRTAEQAGTIEDMHLRLALALEGERMAAQHLTAQHGGLANASADVARSGGLAATAIDNTGTKAVSASRSLGRAVDSALGLNNAFGSIAKQGVYFLGADLVARTLGFQGALDAVGKGLDAVSRGIRDAGSAVVESLLPGFAESARAAEELENRLEDLNAERETMLRERYVKVGGVQLDLKEINEDPALRKQLDFARGRAEEIRQIFERARAASNPDPRTGAPADPSALRLLQEGLSTLDLVEEARLKVSGATDEQIAATRGITRVYKDENEAAREVIALQKELKQAREDAEKFARNLDFEADARARSASRQPASPEQVAEYDARSFEAFDRLVQAGLDRRAEKERELARAIDEQAEADFRAVYATRQSIETWNLLDEFYGEAEAAGERWIDLLERQREATRLAALPDEDRQRAIDEMDARNQLIEAGINPQQVWIRLLAQETEEQRRLNDVRDLNKRNRDDAHQAIADLRGEFDALNRTGIEREHSTQLRLMERLAVGDQTGEFSGLLAAYERELRALGSLREEQRIANIETERNIRLADDASRAAGAFGEAWLLGATKGKDAIKGLIFELERLLLRRFVTAPIVDALSGVLGGTGPGTASALGDVFSGGRLVPLAYGGVVNHPMIAPGPDTSHLMGEAGPEGVLPLRRGPGGKLGVEAYGSGSGVTNIYFNISTPNADSFRAAQRHLIEDAKRGMGR